jgi:hypothetical protein
MGPGGAARRRDYVVTPARRFVRKAPVRSPSSRAGGSQSLEWCVNCRRARAQVAQSPMASQPRPWAVGIVDCLAAGTTPGVGLNRAGSRTDRAVAWLKEMPEGRSAAGPQSIAWRWPRPLDQAADRRSRRAWPDAGRIPCNMPASGPTAILTRRCDGPALTDARPKPGAQVRSRLWSPGSRKPPPPTSPNCRPAPSRTRSRSMRSQPPVEDQSRRSTGPALRNAECAHRA